MAVRYLSRRPSHLHRREQGGFLLLVALSLPVLLGFVGIALNIGFSRMVRSQLKKAADSAAFSGAAAMCSDDVGCWERARDAAVSTLNRYLESGDLGLDPATRIDVAAAGTEWNLAGVGVRIERGILYGNGDFVSTEGTWGNQHPQAARHLVANSVQVQISRPQLIPFKFFFGADAYSISVRSLAVNGQSVQVPIAPFALPLCALVDADVIAPGPELCRGDRYFTATARHAGLLPEFLYEGAVDDGGAVPSDAGTCHWNMRRFARASHHYGVVGLPADVQTPALTVGSITESMVRVAMQAGSPEQWPRAGIGEEFIILPDGLTEPESAQVVWQQISNFGQGIGTDNPYHPAFQDPLTHLTLQGQTDWKSRDWRSDPLTVDCADSSRFSIGDGLCQSWRMGVVDQTPGECQVQFTANPISSYPAIDRDYPIWKVQIPVIADMESDAEACSADPLVNANHEHRIVGFVQMNIYDGDIGTGVAPNWRPSLCEDFQFGPWSFGGGLSVPCNLVRGKVDCGGNDYLPNSTWDDDGLTPILRF